METAQLEKNVIIASIQEGPWEDFKVTRQRVHDTIAASLCKERTTPPEAIEEAMKVEIVSCKRLEKFQMNRYRPNTATFQGMEDKESLWPVRKIFLKVSTSITNTLYMLSEIVICSDQY